MGLLRKLLAWLSVPVISMFALLFYLARPFNPDNNRYLAWVLARVGRWLLGLKRTVEGMENMPQDRPTVIIANHQHNDDLFLMGDVLPPRPVTVGKSVLLWVPFFGQVLWLGGSVILNRRNSHKSVAIMRATGEAIRDEKKSIWVFPEGTRSKGRGLQSFKKGAFHMAISVGAPITMVCTETYHDKTIGWFGRRESVAMRILPPVETKGMTAADVPQLMSDCRQVMDEMINELSANR